MKTKLSFLLLFSGCAMVSLAQQNVRQKTFTHADTLRGSITAGRDWWDVMHYDISVRPDYAGKTISGSTIISYKTVKNNRKPQMQVDLQTPLTIDSVIQQGNRLSFRQEGNAWFINMPSASKGKEGRIAIYYSGKVHEAVRPPWDGGWIWTKDSLGRPWMTVACQGLGASVWFPCKDHQSDEPDKGASLSMTVADSLTAIGNGRLQSKVKNNDGTTTWKWAVVNAINNYCIIPYIGMYVNFKEKYQGAKGPLDVNYWVLDYNTTRAQSYMPPEVNNMFRAFEHWFGPYPFYEDGYQLIETSHTGMEHQSAVSYGNWYKPGYRGRDGSGTGWGMKWDFIIIHESGHEWFGNNITTKDLADMWVHEGFTNYSETLFIDYHFGKDAADAYNAGIRRGIRNDRPIIARYGVNDQGSGDMYPKAGNMLHAIRHGMDDDEKFRSILRGLNRDFYHQTVSTRQVEQYISEKAGFDYAKVFDQYLRTTQVPVFEYQLTEDGRKVRYRYSHCVDGFNLPLVLKNGESRLRLLPGTNWQSRSITDKEAQLIEKKSIEAMYYLQAQAITEQASAH